MILPNCVNVCSLPNKIDPVTQTTCCLNCFLLQHTSTCRQLHKILVLCEDDQGRSLTDTLMTIYNKSIYTAPLCLLVVRALVTICMSNRALSHFMLYTCATSQKRLKYWSFVKGLLLGGVFVKVNLLSGRNTKAHIIASEGSISHEAKGQPISMFQIKSNQVLF